MWTRLDDDFYDHPRIVAAGNEGAGVFCRCLSYCGRYLTDGFVPGEVAARIANGDVGVLRTLLEVGLLEQTDGGFVLRDFLDYNPTADEVKQRRERISEARREAGRRGGRRSGEVRRARARERSTDGGADLRSIDDALSAVVAHAQPTGRERVLSR